MKLLFALSAGALLLGSAMAQTVTPRYIERELVVSYRTGGLAMAALNNTMIGARVVRTYPQIEVQTIRIREGFSVDGAIRMLKNARSVQTVERNAIPEPFFTPNDPLYARQYAPQRINAPIVWDAFRGDRAVIVAIIEIDGFDLTHPDLQGRFLPGFNFIDNNTDVGWNNTGSHATHVTGCAAASTNNGIGVASPAFDVSILPLRMASLDGSIGANVFAADNGARVTNMSYGFPGLPTSEAHQRATTYAWNKNVLPLAAAGNSNTDQLSVPQSDRDVVNIGASDRNDNRAGFSNFGPRVPLAAPGVDVLATVPGGGYEEASGTSMASPTAAGGAALLLSAAPDATNIQLRDALFETADPIGPWVTRGRINLSAALERMPIGIDTVFPVSAVAMDQGSGWSGVAANLAEIDEIYFRVTSMSLGRTGKVAGARVTIPIEPGIERLNRAALLINAKGPVGSTNTVWARNVLTGNFEPIRSFPLRPTAATTRIVLSRAQLNRYIGDSGQLQVVTRAVHPARMNPAAYDYNVDMVRFEARVRRR